MNRPIYISIETLNGDDRYSIRRVMVGDRSDPWFVEQFQAECVTALNELAVEVEQLTAEADA